MSTTSKSGSILSANDSTTHPQDTVQHDGIVRKDGQSADSMGDVAKDQKFAELQAQEIDKVKQSYEQHEDRFGNRG